jgi:phytoene synthase
MVTGRTPESAYAYCAALARRHYENFPVASLMLPRHMRPHIAAIYAFARAADDFADEPGLAPAERLGLLDEWHTRLHGGPSSVAVTPGFDGDAIFMALGQTIRACDLPVELFDDLLSAFRQDVTTVRYATWMDVLDYCRRSANPIGRLVLRVGGYDRANLDRASDAICTALQLTNFWQDLAIDWERGRLYVPLELRDRYGAHDADLGRRTMTPEWRRALAAVTARTRALFEDGRPLCDAVSGRLKWELRFTWLGGTRILDELEGGGFDMFSRRPSLGAAAAPGLIWRACRWRADRAGARPGAPHPAAPRGDD